MLKSDFVERENNERKEKSGTHKPDAESSNLSGPMYYVFIAHFARIILM